MWLNQWLVISLPSLTDCVVGSFTSLPFLKQRHFVFLKQTAPLQWQTKMESINQSLDLSCNSENSWSNWQWVVKSSFVWSNSNRPLSGSCGVYGMQGNISLKNQFACENASKICKKCTQSFKHDDEYHGKQYLKQIRIAASAWHNFTACIYLTALPPLPLHQKAAWHH